jgi:hypothetical protein
MDELIRNLKGQTSKIVKLWFNSYHKIGKISNPSDILTLSYSLAVSPDLAVFKPCFL